MDICVDICSIENLQTSKPPTDSPQQEPMTSHGLLALVTSTKLHNSEGALRDGTKSVITFHYLGPFPNKTL